MGSLGKRDLMLDPLAPWRLHGDHWKHVHGLPVPVDCVHVFSPSAVESGGAPPNGRGKVASV